MGLLMSDTMLTDPLLDDVSPWLSCLSEGVNVLDATLDDAEEEPADSTERARLNPASRPWPKALAVCRRP